MGFKKKLADFKDFMNVLQGKEDIRQKLAHLFQPKDIRTASRFSANQCDFQTDVRTAKKYYPEFDPLEVLAEEQGFVMISHKGLGREEAIKAEQRQDKMPFGLFQQFSPSGKEKKPEEKKAE